MSDDRARKDWPFIRQAYVIQGWSAAKCAEHFKIHEATVKKRAARDKWADERTKLATATTESVASEIATAVALQNASHIAMTEFDLNLTTVLGDKIHVGLQSAGTDAKALKAWVEVVRAFTEARQRVFLTNRDARGLRPGQSSEDADSGAQVPADQILMAEPKPESEAQSA